MQDHQPSLEVCDDGLDNDCDGLVDRADADCAGPSIDCGRAVPSVSTIWPVNHRMIPVAVLGVTGSNGAPATIVVNAIRQDEPVNDRGDGATSPDGMGVGTNRASVRAERTGNGNGRVYGITFTASDASGGVCHGTVSVCVPRDMRNGGRCVDDGQLYDSTQREAY